MSVTNRRNAIRNKYLSAGSYPLQIQGSYAEGSSAQPVTNVRHEVLLGGQTGIVATQFGGHNMGITVGRLATGVYGIAFPDVAYCSIMAGVSVPTGADYQVSVGGMSGLGRIVGATGMAELHITTLQNGATGLNFEASITRVPTNVVTGTVVTLDFMLSGNYLNDTNTLVPY
jgi:hypothetical protein